MVLQHYHFKEDNKLQIQSLSHLTLPVFKNTVHSHLCPHHWTVYIFSWEWRESAGRIVEKPEWIVAFDGFWTVSIFKLVDTPEHQHCPLLRDTDGKVVSNQCSVKHLLLSKCLFSSTVFPSLCKFSVFKFCLCSLNTVNRTNGVKGTHFDWVSLSWDSWWCTWLYTQHWQPEKKVLHAFSLLASFAHCYIKGTSVRLSVVESYRIVKCNISSSQCCIISDSICWFAKYFIWRLLMPLRLKRASPDCIWMNVHAGHSDHCCGCCTTYIMSIHVFLLCFETTFRSVKSHTLSWHFHNWKVQDM